jgi:hypothetical protein
LFDNPVEGRQEMAAGFVAEVEAWCKRPGPFHPGDKIGLRVLDDQMKMIAHETRRALASRSGAGLPERGQESLSIPLAAKKCSAADLRD